MSRHVRVPILTGTRARHITRGDQLRGEPTTLWTWTDLRPALDELARVLGAQCRREAVRAATAVTPRLLHEWLRRWRRKLTAGATA